MPAIPFDTDEVVPVVVTPQARVRYDGNRYSVPPALVRKPVTLRANATEVWVDRKAIRLAKTENIITITTAEIVKLWADSCNATDEAIAEILQQIERYARFNPRKDFPLHDWWGRLSSSSGH